MRTPRLSTTQIVYLVLLALSAIGGAYSGYHWENEAPTVGHTVAAITGHSWFSDNHIALSMGLGCDFGTRI